MATTGNFYADLTIEDLEVLITRQRRAIVLSSNLTTIRIHQKELEFMKAALQRKRAAAVALHEHIKKQRSLQETYNAIDASENPLADVLERLKASKK